MFLLSANTIYYTTLRHASAKIGLAGSTNSYLSLYSLLIWFDGKFFISTGLSSLFDATLTLIGWSS